MPYNSLRRCSIDDEPLIVAELLPKMNAEKIKKKLGRPKGTKKKFYITYEIVPPGTIKRNLPMIQKTSKERWEEIVNICSEIIAEAQLEGSSHEERLS